MAKQQMAEAVRWLLLVELRKHWNAAPGPDDYVRLDDILNGMEAKTGGKLIRQQAASLATTLLQQQFIKALETPNGIVVRITDAGLAWVEAVDDRLRNRRLAMVGAVTGVIGAVTGAIAMFSGGK